MNNTEIKHEEKPPTELMETSYEVNEGKSTMISWPQFVVFILSFLGIGLGIGIVLGLFIAINGEADGNAMNTPTT